MLEELLVKVVLLVLSVGLPYLFSKVGKYIGSNTKNIENGILRSLAYTAVQFVRQRLDGYSDNAKLDEAINFVMKEANKKGLKVDRDEIEKIIEASLRDFKDALGKFPKESK